MLTKSIVSHGDSMAPAVVEHLVRLTGAAPEKMLLASAYIHEDLAKVPVPEQASAPEPIMVAGKHIDGVYYLMSPFGFMDEHGKFASYALDGMKAIAESGTTFTVYVLEKKYRFMWKLNAESWKSWFRPVMWKRIVVGLLYFARYEIYTRMEGLGDSATDFFGFNGKNPIHPVEVRIVFCSDGSMHIHEPFGQMGEQS